MKRAKGKDRSISDVRSPLARPAPVACAALPFLPEEGRAVSFVVPLKIEPVAYDGRAPEEGGGGRVASLPTGFFERRALGAGRSTLALAVVSAASAPVPAMGGARKRDAAQVVEASVKDEGGDDTASSENDVAVRPRRRRRGGVL